MNLLEIITALSIIAGVSYSTFDTAAEVQNQFEKYQQQQKQLVLDAKSIIYKRTLPNE